jgi:predicted O-methyltransferase YrrM
MQFWSESIEKQVGDRVQMLLSDQYLFEAYREFGAETLRRSSVFHGLDRFLTERSVRGRCCFEIGTWNGLTAAVLSRYFDRVVTVDIAHNDLKHRVLSHLGIRNVTCIDIDSNDDKALVWKRYGGNFDFAYLDGDHANDTTTDFDLVKGCGRVLFHEAWPWQADVFALTMAMLPRHEVTHNGMGLALWDSTR